MNFTKWLEEKNVDLTSCTDTEAYNSLLAFTQEAAAKQVSGEGKKRIYYVSAEFLIGRLLTNNLLNLGIYEEVASALEAAGKSLGALEELEPEPSLGNGGLGRLAACFLDSLASLGLNGAGIGLNYHCGLFHQVFENNKQKETPDFWIGEKSWLKKTEISYPISFGDCTIWSQMYDIDVTGYDGRTIPLHLFDAKSVDETMVSDTIAFDKSDKLRSLTLFLYPDDSEEQGRLLRIYQEYFMVANGARLILKESVERGSNLHDLYDYAAVQINDTHPTMIIPELIRLLMEEGIGWDEAVEIVTKTCAYTNHTILAEALETWPYESLEKVVPQLMPIIDRLAVRVRRQFKDPQVQILDDSDRIHMAHIDIHFSHSTNGVAYLHTEILKNSELKAFYEIYPERFNNKTNGITFRRWLYSANPELTALLEKLIGDDFKKDAMELEKLAVYENNPVILKALLDIKDANKKRLAAWLKEEKGVQIPTDSIYDIQIKRLHEYKRQQMNVLYLIHKYLEIKKGNLPKRPITAIFGAKAAPAYTIAKDIIHLILCLQELTQKDPLVSKWLRVIMVENYNVTAAEKLIPAADISEQISLASKEASGTGNMKLMLNGALTLGTEDGANVEIHQLVGDENIYIFGDDSDTVIKRYQDWSYRSREYYEADQRIRAAVDFITSEEVLAVGCRENLERLQKELLNKDWFMTFPDFDSYVKTRERMYDDYEERMEWAKKTLINISKAGYFSSDRTISEYNKEIWKL
ncbi:MAG: glycogen/starch/alpha-glucan phosphorylase [Lachnospiraceae bacterium]|nr:glycogen/starch/alpha-glucan phosphorylase [Lachnospiraceae bacterium]